jgi:nucleotide-binding universal stress UspA family protein
MFDKFDRILVAIDRSDESQHAFQAALAMAKAMNAQVMFVHVISPAEANYPSPLYAVQGTYPIFDAEDAEFRARQWRTVQEVSTEFLQAQTEVATQAGLSAEFTQALGDPGEAICSLAQRWNANLIILGRHGYKGLGEMLMGSVSNYVMHHAPCSVLTVQGLARSTTPEQVAQQSTAS